jgi:hypothetical protein
MSKEEALTAIKKRAQQKERMIPFDLETLRRHLPLILPRDPDLPPSPKPRYRSTYRYPGADDLNEKTLQSFSSFEIATRLFDYCHLEPLLAAHIYVASAKGQVPFHPVSMILLSLYRREHKISRHETLRLLRHPDEGRTLRRCTGFKDVFPSESGLRYFESCITPELQQEINALQIQVLYEAGLLPTKPGDRKKVTLSFDGMLHEARSRMRCSSVKASCYQPAPRPCPAQEKGKRGCDCDDESCADRCRYTTRLDPEARFIIYTGDNKRAETSPNTSLASQDSPSRIRRMVYGYYSYAGQLQDQELATYWVLPGAFGSATCGDVTLFLDNFAYLQERFPWLTIGQVIADSGINEKRCLNAIWHAGALRMVDIRAHQSDDDPDARLARGYDENGHPLCPFGYRMRANGYDPKRRRAKWRCSRRCQQDAENPAPDCAYLRSDYKHGYTVTVGRTHADGSVRLAREIAYGSPSWKKRYHRRSLAESRNSVLQRLGLKRMSVHGFASCYVIVLQGDFIANQRTLVRLVREATALRCRPPS